MSLVGPFSGSGNRFGNLRLASALILASLGLAKVIHHFYFSQQKGIPPEEGREEKEEKVKSKKSVKMSNPAATDSGGDTLGTKAETSAPMSRKERSSSVATVGSVDSGTNNWNDLVDEEDMENEVAKETMEEKKSSGTLSSIPLQTASPSALASKLEKLSLRDNNESNMTASPSEKTKSNSHEEKNADSSSNNSKLHKNSDSVSNCSSRNPSGDLIHKHDSGITSPMEQGAAGGGTNTGNNDLMPLVEESAAGATSHPKSNSSPTSCNNQTLIDGGGGGGLQKRSSSTSGSSCNGSGSDSGQGSEADEQTVFKYQFHLPAYLAGKFIGMHGNAIHALMETSDCRVVVKNSPSWHQRQQQRKKTENRHGKWGKGGNHHYQQQQVGEEDLDEKQVCFVEGTRANIDRCLENIRERFPSYRFPDLTLEQINPSTSAQSLFTSRHMLPGPYHKLANGEFHENLYISAIVTAGHVFVQVPSDPSFKELSRFQQHMNEHYTNHLNAPYLPEYSPAGLLCVAYSERSWWRVKLVSHHDNFTQTDAATVVFIDYGGYCQIPFADLRQIRSDYMTMPQQAVECRLANIRPITAGNEGATGDASQIEFAFETSVDLEKELRNMVVSGQCTGFSPYDPTIHVMSLYVKPDTSVPQSETAVPSSNNQSEEGVLVNRRLVDLGVANWVEDEPQVLLPEQQQGEAAIPVNSDGKQQVQPDLLLLTTMPVPVNLSPPDY